MVCMYLNVGLLYYKLELILWNITNWALHSPSPTVKHAVLITIKCEKCTKIIMIFLISNEFKLYNWKWHHSPTLQSQWITLKLQLNEYIHMPTSLKIQVSFIRKIGGGLEWLGNN